MEKQTAIEWLEIQLLNKMNATPIVDKILIDKAKEMEKDQICWAYLNGADKKYEYPSKYYIETYQKSDMPEIEKLKKDLSIFEDLAAMFRHK